MSVAPSPRHDVVVVGGGIVGFAVLHELLAAGHTSVALVEREHTPGTHQTGRNSNVVHSGLYYAPGSLKARLAVAGCAETKAFCAEHDLPYEECGKVVVATEADELPRMAELVRRGRANGVEVTELDEAGVREREPAVAALAGLWVPSTGICDYGAITCRLADLAVERGAVLHTGRAARSVLRRRRDVVVRTDRGDLLAGQVVVCAGLRSDEIARASGFDPGVRIVPFRGEYSDLVGPVADQVRGLVYPVPDPAFPFLGVHATRGVDGSVHVGPNAVLALAREGYDWRTLRVRELAGTLADPGFVKLAGKQWRYGLGEMYRSLSKRAMAAAVARMLPGVTADDLQPPHDVARRAGVRAQAIRPDGSLVDDFLFVQDGEGDSGNGGGPAVLHVLNAPSPAATAALPIGREIVARLEGKTVDAA
ncbi:L-2-hydroxyglutarate oxidase [Actinomycetospora sp. CA-101289]|uniref:L-2-hydroxyglutarate oxidase n=1 Tax=Actinomycetospora sp. CA-101289 TaxID=3239893 RepID=UPI003D973FDE